MFLGHKALDVLVKLGVVHDASLRCRRSPQVSEPALSRILAV
jgi:hypothetical protein